MPNDRGPALLLLGSISFHLQIPGKPRPYLSRRRCCSMQLCWNWYLHRGTVFATAGSPIARGSMIESLLCRQHVGFLALPNLQSRLLDGAGKRKRQRPRQSRLESDIHGIQTGRGQFTGWPPDRNAIPGTAAGTVRNRHLTVASATSFTSSCWRQLVSPDTVVRRCPLLALLPVAGRPIPEAPCWASGSCLPASRVVSKAG